MNWYDFWLWLIYWLSVGSTAFRVSLVCWCFYSADHAYVCQDNSLWFAPRGKTRSRCSRLASETGLAWLHFVFCGRMLKSLSAHPSWSRVCCNSTSGSALGSGSALCCIVALWTQPLALPQMTLLLAGSSALHWFPFLLQCPSLNEMNQTGCTFV